MLYFFILGRNSALSLAEILFVFGEQAKLTSFADNFAVFALHRVGCGATPNSVWFGVEFGRELNPSKILNNLGGSIKFGEIIEKNPKNLLDSIFYALVRRSKEKKLFFGISIYGKAPLNIKEIGLEIKKRIKEAGRSCRFVTSRERNLSSVVVKTNKLLSPQGAEFVILDDGKEKFLGKTLAVQEFEEYGKRDFPRPARSMTRGMLPPKLAKIMINFSQTPKEGIILDPFCGTGTILSEAAILGYKNLIGADNDPQAIKATEANLEWLQDRFKLSVVSCKLFIEDARQISKKLKPQSVDAIVTEPYLGPPMKGNEQEGQIRAILNDLEKLYLNSFAEFKKILKPGGSVVFVLPIFKIPLNPPFKKGEAEGDLRKKGNPPYSPFVEGGSEGDLSLNIKSEIEKIGFGITNPLPPEIKTQLNGQFGPNGGLIYGRPDQRIWREIIKLKN